MTLTIQHEEDDQRQLKLTIEVSEERVENAMRRKARELAKELNFPGFRKGKVPYRVVIQRLGRDTVRAETIDDMAQEVFVEALNEIDVEPYGQPTFDDLQGEPLVLEFTIPLEPVVTLGSYRELRKEVEPVSVTTEAIDQALEQAQIRHQTVEEVERPVQVGDLVTVSGKGELIPKESESEEEPDEESGAEEERSEVIFDEEQVDLLMDADKIFFGQPFVDNLVGLSAGDEASFTITLAEDLEEKELAGREVSFVLSILNVKNRELPPLDDELAKLEGGHETLESLRVEIEQQLQRRAEDQAKEDLLEAMIDDMLEDATLQYPPGAVEAEIDDMVETFKSQVTRSGWEFEDYLKIQSSTEESLRDDFRENAEIRLRRRLILRQFILSEKLQVQASDVDGIIDERIGHYENEELREQMRNFYTSGAGFDMISSEALSNKVYERMHAILTGAAPIIDSLDEVLEGEEDLLEEE